jgi:hypothetical protein
MRFRITWPRLCSSSTAGLLSRKEDPVEQIIQILKSSYGSMVGFVSHTAPTLFATTFVLVAGLFASRVIKAGVSYVLGALRFESLAARLGISSALERADVEQTPTEVICTMVYWTCLGFVLLATLGTMGVAGMAAVTAVAAIIPKVVLATAILIIGVNVSAFVSKLAQTAAVNAEIRQARLMRNVMHYTMSALVVLLALKTFDVPAALLTQLALITFGAAALGLAIALGLGGRDLARSITEATWQHEQDTSKVLSYNSQLGNNVFPNGSVRKHSKKGHLNA